MTKRETMVEMKIPIDEETNRRLQEIHDKEKITVETIIANFSDAIEFSWKEYLDDYKVHGLWKVRAFLIQMVADIDDKIDDRIEEINKEKRGEQHGKGINNNC